MLQNWRANVDLQVIINVEACARYMAKYAAKGEPRSKAAAVIFKSCVDRLTVESDATTALRTSMLRAVGERDFSAQETAHLLLSEPLYSSTYTFVCVFLDGSREICDQSADHTSTTPVTNPSTLQVYANRSHYAAQFPGIAQLNLFDFIKLYSIVHQDIRKRSEEVIVRTFPKYSPNPRGQCATASTSSSSTNLGVSFQQMPETESRVKNQMTRWSQRHTAAFFRLITHNTAFHNLPRNSVVQKSILHGSRTATTNKTILINRKPIRKSGCYSADSTNVSTLHNRKVTTLTIRLQQHMTTLPTSSVSVQSGSPTIDMRHAKAETVPCNVTCSLLTYTCSTYSSGLHTKLSAATISLT